MKAGYKRLTVLTLLLLPFVLTNTTKAQTTAKVTFKVNTATAPDTLTPVAVVQIRGGKAPLTWGNDTGGKLDYVGGDYWSKQLTFNVGDTVAWKININDAGWEQNLTSVDPSLASSGNRSLIVTKDTVLPVQYFNNGANGRPQYFTPWAASSDTMISIYFRVNMQGITDAGSFGFDKNKDTVAVRGGGPAGADLDWGKSFYLAREVPATNGGFAYDATHFWSGRLLFPKNAVTAGQSIDYKFLLGYNWGRDELQGGAPNRNFKIPTGKKDTTLYFGFYNNQKPIVRANADTVIVTFTVNMTTAIQNGGFNLNDTIVVRSGYFSTGAVSGKEKRLLRVSGNILQVTDTIITSVGKTLDYQYYLIKSPADAREVYYNFNYTGAIASEAERRQVTVTSKTLSINDIETSVANARRQPLFQNQSKLTRAVRVTWTVDLRPAYYTVKAGKTLTDKQGTLNVSVADSIKAWGVWMNGPAVGDWSNSGGGDWGSGLRANPVKKMYDDGTHGDAVVGDSVYALQYQYTTSNTKGQVLKFGIYGGDNEGGFGNNHVENISDADSIYTIASQFGSIDPSYYNYWNFDTKKPQIPTGINDDIPLVPLAFDLSQNYPNPFNPSTTIQFTIPTEGIVTLKIFNVLGQVVATVLHEKLNAGKHTVNFDAARLSSGIYFYQINSGKFIETKKMTLLK